MDLYEILNLLNICYEEIEHPPVYTVEEAKTIKEKISGIGCKNLFLTNNKGKYFLVILGDEKKANLKELSTLIHTSHLSFASKEDLVHILNLEPGSVTALGIINDTNNLVQIIIDRSLKDNKLLIHPNTNTRTISINFIDLIKFIEYENHKYIFI